MPHRVVVWLSDVQTSIDSINAYLGPFRNFYSYQENQMLRRAIERELEIIGEAMNRILDKQPDIAISTPRKIVGLRNLIAHKYDEINRERIWAIIVKDLPVLKEEVEKLLEMSEG